MKKIIPLVLAALVAASPALAQEEPRPNVRLDVVERTYPRDFDMIHDRDFRIVNVLVRLESRVKGEHISVAGGKFKARDHDGNILRSRGTSTQRPALKPILLAPYGETEGWISFKIPAGVDFGAHEIMYQGSKDHFSRWMNVP
jgi:hypothetical protein